MRFDDLDTPSGEQVTRAPFQVASRGFNCFFTASTWADKNVVAAMFAVHHAPSTNSVRGADLGHTIAYSEPDPSTRDDVSATTLDKAA